MSNQLLDDQFGEILDDSSNPQKEPLTKEEKAVRNLCIFSIVLLFLSMGLFIIIRIYFENTQRPPIDTPAVSAILFRNSIYLSIWVVLNNFAWFLVKESDFSKGTNIFLKVIALSMIFLGYYFMLLFFSWFSQELFFPIITH